MSHATDMNDLFWLSTAYTVAARSQDPSTQNGAVLLKDDALLAFAWNRFPAGIASTPQRWQNREEKYRYVAHAEASACIAALKMHGQRVQGSTLYCPWYACTECAKVIIESGVIRIVGHQTVLDFQERLNPSWTESTRHALDMLAEAGVRCDWLTTPIWGAPVVRMAGQRFDPSI